MSCPHYGEHGIYDQGCKKFGRSTIHGKISTNPVESYYGSEVASVVFEVADSSILY